MYDVKETGLKPVKEDLKRTELKFSGIRSHFRSF